MVKTVLFKSESITRKVLYKNSDSNVFVRIAAVNVLLNFVSPIDPISHNGEHNTEIYLHTPTSRLFFSVIGTITTCISLYVPICNFILSFHLFSDMKQTKSIYN